VSSAGSLVFAVSIQYQIYKANMAPLVIIARDKETKDETIVTAADAVSRVQVHLRVAYVDALRLLLDSDAAHPIETKDWLLWNESTKRY